ncbi:MAG: hypothetical protein ACJ79H_23245 [Myxococcales bacterium]
MRALVLALLCAGCVSTPQPTPVSPTALKGVTLSLPTPQDARRSDSIGCGQFAPQLPQALARAVVASLGEAGLAFAQRAPWVLTLSVTFAGTGDEYVGAQRGPPQFGSAPAGLAFEDRGGTNAGWDDTSLALDATLEREGKLVWHGTVTGHARSVPCVAHREKLDEATQDAVGRLRAELIRRIAAD